VLSATVKQQRSPNARQYEYRDITTIAGGPSAGRILATLSDQEGNLAKVSASEALLYGVYGGETINMSKDWVFDGKALVMALLLV
jgi:hypothetical protein